MKIIRVTCKDARTRYPVGSEMEELVDSYSQKLAVVFKSTFGSQDFKLQPSMGYTSKMSKRTKNEPWIEVVTGFTKKKNFMIWVRVKAGIADFYSQKVEEATPEGIVQKAKTLFEQAKKAAEKPENIEYAKKYS